MPMADSQAMHVLVLGHASGAEELERWTTEHAHVEQVDTMEEALSALRKGSFDAVICSASEILALPVSSFSHEAAVILDGVNQGVGIVGESGELEWANPRLLNLPAEVRARVCLCCVETFQRAQEEARSGANGVRGRHFSLVVEGDGHYEITATPVMDVHQRITRVAAVVWETTAAARLQEKLDAIERAGRELLSLDPDQISRLDAHERLSLLEQKVLRCTQEFLRFDNFEIRTLHKKTGQLELVLASGMPAQVLEGEIYARKEGNGIRGYVAAEGRSYICPDATRDPRFAPGIDNARSSLTIPLLLQDQVVGVANFESTKLAAFNEHDRQFAEIFGRYIALSLNVLQLLVCERRTTTGQVGRNVLAEITGPVNDILTDVEGLLEDYIGHDDLRHRLRGLSENAVRIRDAIKEMTAAKPGVTGVRPSAPRQRDPLLEGKRVLIADDEDLIRDTVRDVLTGYGCAVSTASDGVDAIALIAQGPFDLVLSDIRMPRKSGYEVFAAAKEANAATPVILTTGFGYDPNHSIVRARREGLAAVLFKPFKVDQLLDEIRMALRSVAP